MAVAALVVSIVALVVSLLALGWQVYSWRRSGPVVTVETQWAWDLRDIEGSEMLTITARNVGRLPVQIREFSFRTPTDWKFVLWKPMPISDSIEEPLVPGHECTHYFSAAWIRERCVEKEVRLDALRPQVRLGTGKVVVGRKKVRPAHPE